MLATLDTKTAPAPVELPPAVEPTVPDEGSALPLIPITASPGEHICGPMSSDYAFSLVTDKIGDADFITHKQIAKILMEQLGYELVCDIFMNHLALCARYVAGTVKARYLLPEGVQIIRFFHDSWTSCPLEYCDADISIDQIPDVEPDSTEQE